ncbi:hypothetical protein [Chondrinema litorale]|uniref:hypothetical protein n=1 Tax=Chondrinema litorale TaxID=2994555 RepID=UPI0025438F3B|nr:hypothetical protein [Chondrinema litorale]UZR97000.1 hypothetical protein OQ292_23155 [Chondrinema litorale]
MMNNKILAILNQEDIFKIYDDLKKFSETHKVNEYVSSFIELINNQSALIREVVFYGLLN